jgi:hypothetical protein
MPSASVLIPTEVGKVAHVAQALSDLDGVPLAEDLAGPYGVIAKVQAPGLDQLGRLVVAHIQIVDGVTRTLTCTVNCPGIPGGSAAPLVRGAGWLDSHATVEVFSNSIGVSMPRLLWRRCRLWKISRYSKIALASSIRVFQRCRFSSSICMRDQNASIIALS